MKFFIKITLIVISSLIGLFVLFLVASVLLSKCTGPEEKVLLKEYKLLTLEEKKKAINDFINSRGYDDQRIKVSSSFRTILNSSVKYPETVECLQGDEWVKLNQFYLSPTYYNVEDYENGIINAVVDIRSENKFGIKVRNKFFIKFIFNRNFDCNVTDANFLE